MRKIFNVIGTCCLLSASLAFSSCEKTYDEEELNRDIQKKLNEKKAAEEAEWLAKTTDAIVLEGDTLNLPVRVTPELIKDDYRYFNQIIYRFDPSEKDAIIESLFGQTALLSEYGNFDWIDARSKGHCYGEPLKEFIAGSESSNHDELWYFVNSNNVVKEIDFSADAESSYFTIHNFWSQISEDGIVEPPVLELSNPITPD